MAEIFSELISKMNMSVTSQLFLAARYMFLLARKITHNVLRPFEAYEKNEIVQKFPKIAWESEPTYMAIVSFHERGY